MVRTFQAGDLDTVMSIWLNANIEAHHFVDPEYWRSCYNTVKAMIPQAEVYVAEDDRRINGFIGIAGDYIAGIFVDSSARTGGIGSQLLDHAKENRQKLSLSVYKKNVTAVSFYRKRGFQIDAEGVDPQTSESEYTMSWNR
jgi:putative acetyltransferase